MLTLSRILLLASTDTAHTPAFLRAHSLAHATHATLQILRLEGVDAFKHDVGSAADAARVVEYVNCFQADLVLTDCLYVPALDRAFHRPLDSWLLRRGSAPLYLVTQATPPKPLKLLASVDLSHLEDMTWGLNERILELAQAVAAPCGAALHLCNVSGWTVLGDSPMSVPTRSLDTHFKKAVRDAQHEALEGLTERYGIERERQHDLNGVPHQEITRFARCNAFDTLVLGAAALGTDGVLGSTAERVLNRTPCNLLLVQPPSRCR
ncbi:universal stress protein [Pseudomonas rhodesiae]|uniref:universal stress protein n=1 Tax=Pseudomonas rhodesiae TaxID=76760 RepID=UPI0032B275DC